MILDSGEVEGNGQIRIATSNERTNLMRKRGSKNRIGSKHQSSTAMRNIER